MTVRRALDISMYVPFEIVDYFPNDNDPCAKVSQMADETIVIITFWHKATKKEDMWGDSVRNNHTDRFVRG